MRKNVGNRDKWSSYSDLTITKSLTASGTKIRHKTLCNKR